MPIDITKFLDTPKSQTPAINQGKMNIDLGKFGVTPKVNIVSETTPPVESYKQSLLTNAKETMSSSPTTKVHFMDWVKEIPGAILGKGGLNEEQKKPEYAVATMPYQALGSLSNAIKQTYNDFKTNQPISKKAGSVINSGVSVANTVFEPISGLLGTASEFPITKPIMKPVNFAFEKIGQAGSFISDKILNAIPASEETKNNLRKPLENATALIAQVVAGGALFKGAEKGMTKIKDSLTQTAHENLIENTKNLAIEAEKTGPVTTEKAHQIVEQAVNNTADEINNIPLIEKPTNVPLLEAPKTNYKQGEGFIATDKVNPDSLAKSKAINDFHDKLQSFNVDPTPTRLRNLKTAKATMENLLNQDKVPQEVSTIPPIPNEITAPSPKINSAKPTENITLPKTEQITLVNEKIINPPKPVTDNIVVSKLGRNIESSAVEKGLSSGFENLAAVDKITIKDQAKKSTDLVNGDLEKAKNIMNGKEPVPEGLRSSALFTALEKYAEKNNDINLSKELASSPLTAESSVHAQELRLMAENNPTSLVSNLKEVKKAREGVLEKKGKKINQIKKGEVDKIKSEMKKAEPKIKDWKEFITSLTCK